MTMFWGELFNKKRLLQEGFDVMSQQLNDNFSSSSTSSGPAGSHHILLINNNTILMGDDDESSSKQDHNNNDGHDQDQWLQLSIGSAQPQPDVKQEAEAESSKLVELDLMPTSTSTNINNNTNNEFRGAPRPVTTLMNPYLLQQQHNYNNPAAAGMTNLGLQHQHQEINLALVRPIPISIAAASSSSSGSYFHMAGGVGHPGQAPSLDFRVVQPPRRPHSGIWFMLQASLNQEKEPFLPQISKSYLRIKDGKMVIRLVIKYVANKLRLENESEIELRCKGQRLEPFLTLQHVRDKIWSNNPRDFITLLPNSSTTHHIMVLHYARTASN